MIPADDRRRGLAVAVAVGLAVSLLSMLEAARCSPFFSAQISDAEIYDTLGRRVLEGDLGHPDFAYHTQLYPLVVGAVYRLADRPFAPGVYALQVVLGALTVGLTFAIGRKLWDARVALVAALAVALYAPLVSQQTKLLPTVPAATLVTAALWACLRVSGPRGALFAGILLGLLGLMRPELLPLAAVALALEWRARGSRTALALAGGVLAMMAPIALRNAWIGVGPRVTSGQAAATFAAGNGPQARGLYGAVPGLSGAIVDERRELLRLGRIAVGHPVSDTEAAATLWRRSLSELAAHPAIAARAVAWKAARLISGQEPLQDFDPAIERATVVSLAWLPSSFSVALALAALGLWPGRGGSRPCAVLLWAFLAFLGAALLVFFVTSRHRAPAFPVVALLGAAGLVRSLDERRWLALAGALAIGGTLHWFPREDASVLAARSVVGWTNVALAWARQGEPARARMALEAALQIRKDAYLPTVRLAELAPSAGDAERLLRAALSTNPARTQAPLALAQRLRADRPAEAARLVADVRARHPGSVAAELAELRFSPAPAAADRLRALATREPEDLEVLRALADALATSAPAEARTRTLELARERPADGTLCHRLGLLAEQQGDRAEAERWYRRAIRQARPAAGSAYNLALLLLERGDRKGARPLLRAARQAGFPIDRRLAGLAAEE